MHPFKKLKSIDFGESQLDLLQRSSLKDFPTEILLHIFDYLDFESILVINGLSKKFNQLTNRSQFWKNPHFSSNLYTIFFETLSYITKSNKIFLIGIVSNQKFIRYMFKEFERTSSIQTKIITETTSGQINKYHFCLHKDLSILYGLNHSSITQLRNLQIILFFPQNFHDLSLLKGDLFQYNQKILINDYYCQRTKPIIFIVINQDLILKINDQAKKVLTDKLGAIHFYIELSRDVQSGKQTYNLDKILYNLASKLEQIIAKHEPLLQKQKQIVDNDKTIDSQQHSPQLRS